MLHLRDKLERINCVEFGQLLRVRRIESDFADAGEEVGGEEVVVRLLFLGWGWLLLLAEGFYGFRLCFFYKFGFFVLSLGVHGFAVYW